MSAKLRCVLLYSAGHLGSALVLAMLCRLPEAQIVGVVRAEPAPLSRKALRKISHIGWRFAWLLMWQRLVQFVMFYLVAPLLSRKPLQAAWQAADAAGIASHRTANINDEATLHFLHAQKPDLLVSAYFSQILKAPVLQVAKLGALNIHPGLLPDYKGAMNYFWVLKNGADRAGVSVHWMDEGIDTGAVLAQRSFTFKPHTTQQQVLAFSAVVGAKLLARLIRQLARGITPAPLPMAPHGTYYPMPGAAEFDSYFARRRFFRIRDTLALIAFRARRYVV